MTNNPDLEALRDDLFRYLNCYEVDASEVSDGMAYIDSREAGKMTADIMHLFQSQQRTTLQNLLDSLPKKQTIDMSTTVYLRHIQQGGNRVIDKVTALITAEMERLG